MIDLVWQQSPSVLAGLLILIHLGGIVAAVDALLTVRSSQGALAWAFPLVIFPYAALPIYLIFGRRRFQGYRRLAKRMTEARRALTTGTAERLNRGEQLSAAGIDPSYRTLATIANSAFVADNALQLLSDGKAFFEALLSDIRAAQQHVYLCFYIVRNDRIGNDLKRELLAARARGVTVWFLYDEVGSFFLPRSYVRELLQAGALMMDFGTRKGRWNYFQLNFRNHRKIAIIDRHTAYVGGFNIGDEYLGRSHEFGCWRDTQVRIEGPAVAEIESIFLADWSWATQKTCRPDPIEFKRAGAVPVLTVATGAIDDSERCLLFFLEMINSAKWRLWIASPYFVPDEAILNALILAALRGVDVRLLLPEKSDHLLVWLAGIFCVSQVGRYGVKSYRYKTGFMHQKVWVVDNSLAMIGTANLDNRSLRLSFEICLVAAEERFVAETAEMLERDFAQAILVQNSALEKLPFLQRVGAGIARLFSPVL